MSYALPTETGGRGREVCVCCGLHVLLTYACCSKRTRETFKNKAGRQKQNKDKRRAGGKTVQKPGCQVCMCERTRVRGGGELVGGGS